MAHEEKTKCHKGIGEPIVQTGFGCQRKSNLPFLTDAWWADLDIRGQYRIRWGQDSSKQYGLRDGEIEHPYRACCNPYNRQRHAKPKQTPSARPADQAERSVDLQPCSHNGDNENELKQNLCRYAVGCKKPSRWHRKKEQVAESNSEDRQTQGSALK